MGRAYFEVGHEILREALKLPEDSKIVGITQTTEECLNGYARIYVESSDLPEVPEGGVCMRVSPSFRITVTHTETTFESWA